MTKLRQWHTPNGQIDPESETARDASIRAAAEAIGRPMTPDELPSQPEALELQPYGHRSHRDGQWKRFGREVFVVRLASSTNPCCGSHVWLPPAEVEAHVPVSPTAAEIVSALVASEVAL